MMTAFLITLLTVFAAVPDTLLEPATVTALKESTPLEMIAAPVSIIRREALEADGIYRPVSLSSRIPGLHIPDYGASLTSTVYLRGLGSRMENPVLGLYVDGFAILDKNAYDFDWEGIRAAVMLRGPQGTLFGRNAMGGVLSLRTLSPSDNAGPSLHLEYGSANSLRIGASWTIPNNTMSATFRHTDGYFENIHKHEKCDPYNGLSLRWKWEKFPSGDLYLSNLVSANVSREGGFAYGLYRDGMLQPVSYNDEGSYSRISALEGFRARYTAAGLLAEGAASLQLLADDMRMDQDYTPRSVFTLQQKQLSGAGTLELTFRREDTKATWQPLTGIFAMYRRNQMSAPVSFKRDGIESLILDNANANIPSDIGYLSIPDQSFPVSSEFIIHSWNAAVFHESVFNLDKWTLTAGLRLDYEGGLMNYDCLTELNYQFIPTMRSPKAFSIPYRGSISHSGIVLLPKLSVMFHATTDLSFYIAATKGYRAGGFNTQIFSDILQGLTMNGIMKDLGVYLDRPTSGIDASATEYAPEHAWNYEIGTRLDKEALRLESSLYYISVRNQQLTVFPPGTAIGRMMTNAGKSRSLGAELSLAWNPGDFHGEIDWSYCDARFVSYIDRDADYSGNRVPYVPEHTLYVGAGYRFGIGGNSLSIDAGLRGAGPIYWNEQGNLKEPLILLLSGRAAFAFDKTEIFLRGENLTDAAGHSFYFKSVGNEFFARMKPRIITAGITIKL